MESEIVLERSIKVRKGCDKVTKRRFELKSAISIKKKVRKGCDKVIMVR